MLFISSLRSNWHQTPSLSPHPPPRSDGTLWRLSSRSFLPPGAPLPITHPNLGAFGSGSSQWEFITIFRRLFLFCALRDKTRGGGREVIFNIALIPVVIPIKSILAYIKGVILDASLKLAKASAKRASLNTRHRRACLSLHARRGGC